MFFSKQTKDDLTQTRKRINEILQPIPIDQNSKRFNDFIRHNDFSFVLGQLLLQDIFSGGYTPYPDAQKYLLSIKEGRA